MGRRSKIKIEGSTSLTFIWLCVCLFLTVTVIFPLLCVLFTPKPSEVTQVLASSVWKQAAINTLLETISSTSAAVFIGFVYAYAVVKGNIPFARFFSFIPLIHLVTPPFVGGLSFILLLGRQGFITHTILGLDVSLYGFWGLLIAQSLCFFPMAYMILVQTLQGINPSLEKAGEGLGAGGFKIFSTITLPLSLPGVVSAFLFIAVSVMSDFGNPMIVAGRYKVLAVEIYTQLTGWVNKSASVVLGIMLVIPSVLLFLWQSKLNKNMNFATIGGRGGNFDPDKNDAHNKKSLLVRILLTVFCAFISFCVLAQFLAIIAGAFQQLWGINKTFTLNHIKNICRWGRELKNSLFFALMGAFLSTLIACISSYLVYRTKSPLKKYIDISAQLPSAIPGTLFGLAISLAAARLKYTNSSILIVIAITIGFMPFSYRIISSAFSQIRTTMDDGAVSLGASKVRTLFTVLMPVMKGSIFYSFIYDFVRGVGTMSTVIFLVSFNTPLASIKILNLAEQGFWGDAAALALVLTLITFGVLAAGNLIIKIWSRKK